MISGTSIHLHDFVALLTESVDRNITSMGEIFSTIVALLTESVDRNQVVGIITLL